MTAKQETTRQVEIPQVMGRTIRTSEGLRDTLFDVLDGINAGKITAPEAQAVCKVCAQITNSVNTEIEFYKHIGRHGDGSIVPRTILKLGAERKADDAV